MEEGQGRRVLLPSRPFSLFAKVWRIRRATRGLVKNTASKNSDNKMKTNFDYLKVNLFSYYDDQDSFKNPFYPRQIKKCFVNDI